ncbi:iron complex transport system permease protein [Brevibacterium sp. Mu109]|uniref:FecCD family ABC transporter permease n=1 Tax=Brevibacterium sp. Mu109 TaxID=1255669 RepID=UPI000C3E5085|nr:iron chelate uptake ABC transporter family permease subunit [Brevibacterium sp. Mu109]SMX87051.1 iron complex transport system permease protein [Brevibacterium sp. Mu109]
MTSTTQLAPPADSSVVPDSSSDSTFDNGIAQGTSTKITGLLVALIVLGVLIVLSIAVGANRLGLHTVWDAITGSGSGESVALVRGLRVPRTVAGLVVGVALGLAGALIQALTRNPLADPGILGVNSGAAFFVVVAMGVFHVRAVTGYVWFALFGALLVTFAVYLIGSVGRRSVDPIQLTLAGVAVGAVLTGAATAMMLMDPGTFEHMRSWNAGAISGLRFDTIVPVLPFLAVGAVLALLVAHPLNAIALGDDLAKTLGVNVNRIRIVVVVAVTLLAGGATALAGPIGFVGLMVPHVARWFVGPDQRWIMAYTVAIAPCLLLASDVLGRIVIAPAELPVGVVTAFVGAPVLILLVHRRRVSGL